MEALDDCSSLELSSNGGFLGIHSPGCQDYSVSPAPLRHPLVTMGNFCFVVTKVPDRNSLEEERFPVCLRWQEVGSG